MAFWKNLFSHEQPATTLPEVVRAMSHHSTKLHQGEVPELCFIGAPFGGSSKVPKDLGTAWGKANQALAAASALLIEDETLFEKLSQKLANTKTLLVPDISASEILGDCDAAGSLKHRATIIMEHNLQLTLDDWECFPMVYMQDPMERCSPVGFLFVFRRS